MIERPRAAHAIGCVALTTAGLRSARRLRHAFPEQRVDIAASARALAGMESDDIERFDSVAAVLPHLWQTHDRLVLFFALGAATRLIAPLLGDKRTDPAVVVVDDGGRFAISVVSGHLGGANALAEAVAAALDATPVITTASDVHRTLAVDLLGRSYGWRIEPSSRLTAVAAALANAEPVAVVQDAGERDWWSHDQPLPTNVMLLPDEAALVTAALAGVLWITDQVRERLPVAAPCIIYRPRSLVIGMGCRRGVPVEQLAPLLEAVLAAHRLSPLSVRAFATAAVKGEEPGLLALARRYDVPLLTYPEDQLARVVVPTPSERVRALVGTSSVSEAAALLASDGGSLLVAKRKGIGCTVAIARCALDRARATPAARERLAGGTEYAGTLVDVPMEGSR